MMNNSNETHTNCLKRMNVAMEIYSLETDLGHLDHYKLVSTLIIVFLISDCFDYFWVKAIFQFCICVLPEVSFNY